MLFRSQRLINLGLITYSSNIMKKSTWSDYVSSDEESSSDESSSEEELVSNIVAFMTSHSILEDVCQDSLYEEVDPNH